MDVILNVGEAGARDRTSSSSAYAVDWLHRGMSKGRLFQGISACHGVTAKRLAFGSLASFVCSEFLDCAWDDQRGGGKSGCDDLELYSTGRTEAFTPLRSVKATELQA